MIVCWRALARATSGSQRLEISNDAEAAAAPILAWLSESAATDATELATVVLQLLLGTDSENCEAVSEPRALAVWRFRFRATPGAALLSMPFRLGSVLQAVKTARSISS